MNDAAFVSLTGVNELFSGKALFCIRKIVVKNKGVGKTGINKKEGPP